MSVALRFLFPSLFIALCCARIGATQDSNTNYRALVESYRRNGGDEIDRVLRVRREVIDRAVDDALSAPAGWAWNELRAAAMLHSEAAISALRAKDSPACDLHITFAQRLLDRVVSLSRAQQDFAWRWYMIAPHLVGSLGEKGIGKRLDAYAREKWGRDTARTQYLRGLEFESKFGGDNGQEMYFIPAAVAFSDALRENPELRVAALHLGRLRMLQGHRDEAAALFRSALGDVDPSVAYLAALFLGSLEEREERFDAAETLYRDALARVPYGQSAPLALAELLSRTGREAEARQALADRLLRIDAAVIEPLWTYTATAGQEIGTRFDLLRMEVRK